MSGTRESNKTGAILFKTITTKWYIACIQDSAESNCMELQTLP